MNKQEREALMVLKAHEIIATLEDGILLSKNENYPDSVHEAIDMLLDEGYDLTYIN